MAPKSNKTDRRGELLKILLSELRLQGGRARPKNLFAAAAPKAKLTERELSLNNSGYPRWETDLRFYSTDCVKAGWLQKSGGYWTLTEKGEQALDKLSGPEFIREAARRYNEWRATQQDGSPDVSRDDIEVVPNEEQAERQTIYELAIEQAAAEIEDHVQSLGAYEFQDVVAELLRGMGYHVAFIAPPGRDGGIDIVAYKDPLGSVPPRIFVQVKHRESKLTVKEVRELEGLIRHEGDMGLLVSSGGFTREVEQELRASRKHIDTMDLERLVRLWTQHYDTLTEKGKALLPLVRVAFLKPEQEEG